MMNNRVMTAFAVFFGVFVSAAEPAIPGKANVSDKLNLRVGPGLGEAVAGRVEGGTDLVIHGQTGNWLAVELPPELPVYLSEAKIDAEGKLIGELNLRTGMGANFSVLTTLPKGTVVSRLEERRNGWVRVKLADDDRKKIRLYAAAFCVTHDTSRIGADGKIIPAAGEKAAEEKAAEEKKPAAPVPAAGEKPAEKSKLVLNRTGEKIDLTGIVHRWKYSEFKETDYALLNAPDGFNQAFIFDGDASRLEALKDKKVKVSGEVIGRASNNGAAILKLLSIEEIPVQ